MRLDGIPSPNIAKNMRLGKLMLLDSLFLEKMQPKITPTDPLTHSEQSFPVSLSSYSKKYFRFSLSGLINNRHHSTHHSLQIYN